MRVSGLSLACLIMSLLLISMAHAKQMIPDNRQPDENVIIDLNRYAGTWYQLYDSTNDQNDSDEFKKREGVTGECVDTKVIYTPQPDGTLRLKNECREQKPDGKLVTITGLARSTNPQNTMLKVRFDPFYLRPFEFDYWILWVDRDYKLALLGGTKSSGYTILSRTPVADENLLSEAKSIAKAKGYKEEYTKPIQQSERF